MKESREQGRNTEGRAKKNAENMEGSGGQKYRKEGRKAGSWEESGGEYRKQGKIQEAEQKGRKQGRNTESRAKKRKKTEKAVGQEYMKEGRKVGSREGRTDRPCLVYKTDQKL